MFFSFYVSDYKKGLTAPGRTLRGYSPIARRNLRQLRITRNPRSVLDEEWVQYFRDGLVEITHSGRSGVRPELRELIGRLLDEFQDTP
jgi:hypothetical protein